MTNDAHANCVYIIEKLLCDMDSDTVQGPDKRR
jgi:hypothetical protein